jgi:restriction system protein
VHEYAERVLAQPVGIVRGVQHNRQNGGPAFGGREACVLVAAFDPGDAEAVVGGADHARDVDCDLDLADLGERVIASGIVVECDGALGGERGSDCSAGAQLGRAGRQTGGNSWAENPEPEQREGCEHQCERILERRLVCAEPLGELAEQCGSDADDGDARAAMENLDRGARKPIDVDAIDQLTANMGKTPYDRAMLIGRFGFTAAAVEAARLREPVAVELLDLEGIGAWIHRLEVGKPGYAEKVQILIRSISHEFAKLVSQTPDALDHLEWRDLERMMARVMEGLGFKNAVSDFMSVIVAENRTGGLFLSTSGYSADRTEGLTEVTRDRLWFGDKRKVVLLAKTYVRMCDGLWSPPDILPEVLFEGAEPA